MVKTPALNGCSHLMMCALATNPLETRIASSARAGTETGADALAPKSIFLAYCACRRHQCCPFMMVSENLGTFSLLGQHRTSYCLPVKVYMGMPEVKRKPVVATRRQFFVRQSRRAHSAVLSKSAHREPAVLCCSLGI